jgi:hypothetical protein
MSRSVLALIAAAMVVAPTSAQPKPAEIPVRALSITPAAAPEPAMRWRLLPELRDTAPGNAAVLYYRAFAPEWWDNYRRNPKMSETLAQASTMPLGALRDEARDANGSIGWVRDSSLLKEMDRAARRQYCDWDLVTRAREEGLGMLLPDIQSFRSFAPLLAVRARIELADGNFEQAEHSLQTGMALGRHLGDSPTLIQSLVAAAITTAILDQVEEWIRTPNSPNLYWALANLPQPFVDLRKAYQGERMLIDNLLPGFREDLANRSAEPMTTTKLEALRQKLVMLADQNTLPVVTAVVVMKKYAAAKDYLRAHGWAEETVDALPAVQVVLLCEVATYDRLYDEMVKWVGLPYAQARAGYDKAEELLKREVVASGSPGMSLAGLLLPATIKVAEASNRIDRKIAALQCAEAIRLYAAAQGRLPSSLAEITEMHVPVNPGTGAAFEYKSDGVTASLLVPSAVPRTSVKYEISIRK